MSKTVGKLALSGGYALLLWAAVSTARGALLSTPERESFLRISDFFEGSLPQNDKTLRLPATNSFARRTRSETESSSPSSIKVSFADAVTLLPQAVFSVIVGLGLCLVGAMRVVS